MLNLLFISDNPKVEYVKGVLQPVLKVIIDVVTDFDHGLKDVFEKRPATVCIQDQIGGVTGESVARHIQMLLGTSAPNFILLHTGNGKAKAIKGLYEYLIDLSQSNDAVADELKNTLKLLLGDQWEKIFIPPKLTPASVRLSVAVPEESREDADKLVDDFLFDLETSGFSVADDQPPAASVPDKVNDDSTGATQFKTPLRHDVVPGTVESERAQAINDDLSELLLMVENKGGRDESSAVASSALYSGAGTDVIESSKSATVALKPPSSDIAESPAPTETSSSRPPLEKPVAFIPVEKEVKSSPADVTLQQIQQTPPAAEFRVSQNTPTTEEHIPDDLLLEFEDNYRSESPLLRRSITVLLVCFVCVAGGWYLVKQKPELVVSLKQRLMPPEVVKQTPVTVPVETALQKPASSPVPQTVITPPLPAFIPKDGHDKSFALKNPGWERYVGKINEYRIFIASGRIMAVQVLAGKDRPISESLLKSVLQEFTGSTACQITSQSMKAGVHVENGRIQDKGEVVIYRKNGAVKAFVVSVN